jgi:hypothetical protein
MTQEPTTLPAPPEPANAVMNILAVIERAAMNPEIDVLKMEKLLEMQERIMAKQAEMAFNQAMTALQAKLPSVNKSGMIEFEDKNKNLRQTPFARYEDIDAVIRPLLIEAGFSITFNSEWGETGALIFGTLSHRDGHHKTASIRLPLDTSGSKNNLQAMGSTLSYGKRYLVGMLLNIVTKGEDDDGKGATPVLTNEQAVEIDLLVGQVKADKAKFLSYMGVKDVREIKATDYQKAMTMLNAKKAENAKKVGRP